MYLPHVLVLGSWLVRKLVSSAFAEPRADSVTVDAHIGGFITGMALLPLFKSQ
ncbi:MAG TPA: hypothetical protein VEI74_03950 [Candidatus Methylomirabilis sp.]|nr:hypothetical protein [Candidatus Methylomirabilis sp.]